MISNHEWHLRAGEQLTNWPLFASAAAPAQQLSAKAEQLVVVDEGVLHLFPDNLHLFPIPETCKWPPKRRFANVPHTKDLQMAPKTEICKCSPFQRLSNVPLPNIGNLQMFPIPEICKWPPKRRFANVPHELGTQLLFYKTLPKLPNLTFLKYYIT